METTLTTKGQITLPKGLRDALHLKTGDKILFEAQEGGAYLLRAKIQDVRALKGLISYQGAPKTLEDMTRAIHQNAENWQI